MKLGIINSAFGQAGVDTATGLQHIARIGFDCVDIFTEAMKLSLEEKRTIARTCEKENLPIVSLPVVATGLIDFNDPVREFHVARCKAFLDLAAEFGKSELAPRAIFTFRDDGGAAGIQEATIRDFPLAQPAARRLFSAFLDAAAA